MAVWWERRTGAGGVRRFKAELVEAGGGGPDAIHGQPCDYINFQL